jgi:ABC-type antimicrobial peptide transport system permease subunit
MAVGARPHDVLLQFLAESLVLAAVGGLFGLGAGALGAQWMASAYGWKFFFPTSAALLAVAFSGGIGVLFGLYPAIRASRLDPITALRYES